MRRDWVASVTVVCLVLGLLLALQFRIQSEKDRVPAGNSELMVHLYNEAKAQEAALLREHEQLSTDLRRASEGKSVLTSLTKELQKASLLAGTSKVKGPGVAITLESPVEGARRGDEELFLVHDEDLINLINELAAAGAEAISINGERRVAATEIRSAGALMSVNNRSIGEPYVIRAIGNAEGLERSLAVRGGILDSLRAWGISVKLERVEDLVLPAYRSGPEPPPTPEAPSPTVGGTRQ